MTAIIGCLLVICVCYGGGQFALDQVILGIVFTSVGTIGLGVAFAHAQYGGQEYGFTFSEEGLTVGQLKAAIARCADETRVFVGDQGINPVGSAFECLLDGGRALVIERRVDPEADTVEVYRPRFESHV